MTEVQPGQIWEMYSDEEKRWTRVIVTQVVDGNATLRHEGVFDFVTAGVDEMENSPEQFRHSAPED